MRFNPGRFDAFLNKIGQQVEWRRSYSCACVNPNSGAPDPKHALCQGKGRLWDPPVATITGIASQQVQLEWQNSGQYESGDMVLSIPQNSPLWEAGQFDRIMLLTGTDAFSMPLQRGSPRERLLFRPQRIERCFWHHPQSRETIVEGTPPQVDAQGNLSWPGGVGEPPTGITYSLSGVKFDEYFVFQQLPSDRNQHQGMRLPRRVTVRKWDLYGR